MKLKTLYDEIVKKGSEADPRGSEALAALLKARQEEFAGLADKEKELFDRDSLTNPFSDTRFLWGDLNSEVKSVLVGIDVDGSELLLADRLKEKGVAIDAVISHHPQGKAYANFYEVMDLQTDVFSGLGVSLSVAENMLARRKGEVERRVSGANHQRAIDFARLLKINFLSMHTPCDNLAYRYIEKLIEKEKPGTVGSIIDLLMEVPEYKDAALHNNPPRIFVGSKKSRVSRVHIEFTGGTEGPVSIYDKLSAQGIDTIIAMHQSEEHYKKCKETNINVIVASHIASDSLGVNCMLDHLESKGALDILEFSGFKRFSHK